MMRIASFVCLLSLVATAVGQVNHYPLAAAYTQPWELHDRLADIAALRPDIVHIDTLGFSGTRGLPIVALRVSDNADRDEPAEPAILFCGSHQGEEVLGLEIVLHNARRLVEAYGVDAELTRLVNASEVWFVPVVCVEGWRWVAGGRYFLKRKNDTDSDWDGVFDLVLDGVDLNKNYPVFWEQDYHTAPHSDYYKGPWPASEPETEAMMAFFERERPAMALFYHSSATGAFSERIFFPWRLEQEDSPDWPTMCERANRLAAWLPRDYTPGFYEVFTGRNFPRGYARNYIYAAHRTYAFTIEVGGNVQLPTGEGAGVIHPPVEQLRRIEAKHWGACREALRMLHQNLVAIQVVNPAGEPLPGVRVSFPDWDDSPQFLPVRTNEDGRVFRYLPPERWVILVDNQTFWLDASLPEALIRLDPCQPE
ncbi:MAG: hypothetical protein K8R90_03440 [Candidatus Cloacimonetes bacterium]|nr:hypothetical protein [Candidatus Cloacimonadota bacterium]